MANDLSSQINSVRYSTNYHEISVEQASREIKRFFSRVDSNPKHPYLDKSHCQHHEFVEHLQKLCQIVKPQEAAETLAESEKTFEAAYEKGQ